MTSITQEQKEELRNSVRYMYDLQGMRIALNNRASGLEPKPEEPEEEPEEELDSKGKKKKKKKPAPTKRQIDNELHLLVERLKPEENKLLEEADDEFDEDEPKEEAPGAIPPHLSEADRLMLRRHSTILYGLELDAAQRVTELLKPIPIYNWLEEQKGCGPLMSAVLLTEIDIHKCDTVSQLWSYCGLIVDRETGKAIRREKGKKSGWNPFLKTKLVGVLGTLFVKLRSPWRDLYDNYKHRKSTELVPVCMLCEGHGALKSVAAGPAGREKTVAAKEGEKGVKVCYNCEGKKTNVPWGRGNKHRHQAAIRYMMKIFLAEFWKAWRKMEGLPVGETYAEAALGVKHGEHTSKGELKPRVNPKTGEAYRPIGL